MVHFNHSYYELIIAGTTNLYQGILSHRGFGTHVLAHPYYAPENGNYAIPLCSWKRAIMLRLCRIQTLIQNGIHIQIYIHSHQYWISVWL